MEVSECALLCSSVPSEAAAVPPIPSSLPALLRKVVRDQMVMLLSPSPSVEFLIGFRQFHLLCFLQPQVTDSLLLWVGEGFPLATG